MKHILALLALSFILAPSLLAQESAPLDSAEKPLRPNLRLIARSYGDSVVLRWGTTTHTAWKVAGSKGYMIERYELRKELVARPTPTVLTASPVKPLTIDEWKARYRPEDTLAGAAVQALYGQTVVTSDDPFGSIYEMYLQQKNMFGFALVLADIAPRIADGLGLRFVDRNIDRDRTYLYRIYSLANNPDEPIDTAFVVVSPADRYETRSVESIEAEEGEKLVVLKWDRHEHIQPFTGYFIQRSLDGGKTFTHVNNLPYLPAEDPTAPEVAGEITYRIQLQENYRPVHYRIVGIDAFGEVSPNSKVIVAMGRDRTAPTQPRMLPLAIVDGKSVRVAWELDTLEDDLAGFHVGKSESVDGPFEPIGAMLSRDARSFVDENVNEDPQHYYVVVAVDTAGNLTQSAQLLAMFPDSIPPAMPVALGGTIDSNGIVRLHWDANGERDLQGYRVFYANQDDHEFQQLTTDITADTTFTDTLTLETLSEEIYYKVTALDRNFNHSEFTAVLTLKKPDVVAPSAPVVTDVAVNERGIEIKWEPSPSRDVTEHMLYRRPAGEEKWEMIARGSGASFAGFTDTTATREMLYEYSLDARDDAGITSLRSNVVTARLYSSGTVREIDGVTHTIDKDRRRIVLRWKAPSMGAQEIYLYRAAENGELMLYRSLDAASTEFADDEIMNGASYRYGVKVVTSRGEESPMVTTDRITYN